MWWTLAKIAKTKQTGVIHADANKFSAQEKPKKTSSSLKINTLFTAKQVSFPENAKRMKKK